MFCTALNACFQIFGMVNQFNDFLQLGISANGFYLNDNRSFFDNRSGKYRCSSGFHHAQRFACHRGFVDIGFAVYNRTINRNDAARPNTDAVIYLQVCHWHQPLYIAVNNPDLFGLNR